LRAIREAEAGNSEPYPRDRGIGRSAVTPVHVVGKVTDQKSPSFGYGAQTGLIIIDPAKVVRGRLTGREFGRWTPGDSGSDGCRKAEEGFWLSTHAGRRHGWDGLLSSGKVAALTAAKIALQPPSATDRNPRQYGAERFGIQCDTGGNIRQSERD
jgi:hypothetical protein